MFKIQAVDIYDNSTTNWGLYFTAWRKQLGDKPLYTPQELASLPVSQTLKKRLLSAKPGTSVQLSRLSTSKTLCALRVDQTVVETYEQQAQIEQQLAVVREQIRASVPTALLQQEKELEKQLKAVRKVTKGK